MGRIFNCATASSKKGVNQDYCVIVKNEVLGFTGVIVADGIGSHFKAEIASKFSCVMLKKLLEEATQIKEIDFEVLYRQVKIGLIDLAKNAEDFDFNTINKNESLGTTLICILEFEKEYAMAYAGNGCIWFIDGRFNQFSKNHYLPWNSINILNPHTIEEEGKAALYRYISISDTQYLPTVMRINKNPFSPGEIIVAATDGVFSNDAVPIGKDSNETIWIKGEASMPILYEYLSAFLLENPKASTSEDLQFTLTQFLDHLKRNNLMHDDTSIGVLVSENTINFHQVLFEQRFDSTNSNEKDINR